MRRVIAVLLALLVAAVPMRAVAVFAAGGCASHPAAAVQSADDQAVEPTCEHAMGGASLLLHPESGHEGAQGPHTCSHCTACAAGCGLPPLTLSPASGPTPDVGRIPFHPPFAGGHFPHLPDRPPLAR